jgi:hypothetical protein
MFAWCATEFPDPDANPVAAHFSLMAIAFRGVGYRFTCKHFEL